MESGVATASYLGVTLHWAGRAAPPRKLAWKGARLALGWSPSSRYIAAGE
jgi:hypothetical protein